MWVDRCRIKVYPSHTNIIWTRSVPCFISMYRIKAKSCSSVKIGVLLFLFFLFIFFGKSLRLSFIINLFEISVPVLWYRKNRKKKKERQRHYLVFSGTHFLCCIIYKRAMAPLKSSPANKTKVYKRKPLLRAIQRAIIQFELYSIIF